MINQAQILGRVGKIDCKTTNGGVKIINLSMVTSKKYVKNGQKEEKVTWHNITLFSKLAEIAEQYVAVGDLLYIQGEMDSHKYTTTDNQERIKFYIIAHELKLMPKSKEYKAETPKAAVVDDGFEDDGIPW